jgi:hypothetical protein
MLVFLAADKRHDQAGTALSTTYAKLDLGAAVDAAPASYPSDNASVVSAVYDGVPARFYLDHLEVQVDTIAAGATTLTAFLSWDTSGDYPASNEATATIKTGKTTATKGSAVFDFKNHMARPPGLGTAGRLYLWLKTDAGTCNAVGRMIGSDHA